MAMKSSPEWKFGRIGEEVLRDWLKRQGYYLVPTSLIETGGAPLLESHLRQFVLPDFLASRGGVSAWVDAKAKARMTINRIRGREESGFALRHWRDYLAVQGSTGIRGAIAFIHSIESKLYFGFFDQIGVDAVQSGEPNVIQVFGEAMIFFNLSRFIVYSLEDSQLLQKLRDATIPPTTVRPWEGKAMKPHSDWEPIQLPNRPQENDSRNLFNWQQDSE